MPDYAATIAELQEFPASRESFYGGTHLTAEATIKSPSKVAGEIVKAISAWPDALSAVRMASHSVSTILRWNPIILSNIVQHN